VNSPVVTLLQTECHLKFGRYVNGTVGIQATVADQTSVEYGEDFCTVTVNYEANWQGQTPYARAFPFPAVVLKNYSENEGVVDDLVKAGVVTPGAYLSGSNGTVEACLLTEKWQAIAKEQFGQPPTKKEK